MFFPYVYSGQVGQTRDMLGGRFSCWNPPGDIPPHTRTGKPCRGRSCRSCNGSSRAEARRFSCRFSANIRPSAQSTGLTGDRDDQQSQTTEEECLREERLSLFSWNGWWYELYQEFDFQGGKYVFFKGWGTNLISWVTANATGGIEDISTFILTEISVLRPDYLRTVSQPALPSSVPVSLLAVTLQLWVTPRRGGDMTARTQGAGPDIARLYSGFVRTSGTLWKVK